jgi:hypothetical protein
MCKGIGGMRGLAPIPLITPSFWGAIPLLIFYRQESRKNNLLKRELFLKKTCKPQKNFVSLQSLSWEYGFEWRTNYHSVRDTTYLPAKRLKLIY